MPVLVAFAWAAAIAAVAVTALSDVLGQAPRLRILIDAPIITVANRASGDLRKAQDARVPASPPPAPAPVDLH
jgi:hypothetical protein